MSLRKRGNSYTQIHKFTNVPKSTLSDWLSDEEWSIKVKRKLIKNNKLNLIRAAEVLTRIRKARHEIFLKEAKIAYDKFKNDLLFTFGLGIYWGEGDKKSGNIVVVTNTDPNMLRVAALFYRRYLNLDESKLRISLFIYKDINIDFAMNFWSRFLKVPRSQFIKVKILKSRSRLTKTKSKYGICSLYRTR